ncbi:PLP-dependent aminotransferase family protein [Streptomyces sp. NPDC003023]|uniref:aminotransferase-like domain-containing protein n=1 Tax=Streptomyces sp. NPDC003023 TaxID=3364675 RepID=UPI0036CAAD8F
MTESWATFGADLHLELRGSGLRQGLMDALREAVRTGRLAPGVRLPSSRSLAADLGVARNTVADAYAELVAEGWLTARQGSGTRVAQRSEPRKAAGGTIRSHPPRVRPAYSLMPGNPDLAAFPRAQWLKAARRALGAAPHEAFGYGDPRGRVELRTALADYLARTRGVYADPGRIVICSGFVHGLMLMGKVLRQRRVRAVAVESYGLDVHWNLLTEAGLRIPALPFDALGTDTRPLAQGAAEGAQEGAAEGAEEGAEEGAAEGAAEGTGRRGGEAAVGGGLRGVGAVLMTPAHQFPLGMPLHPDRRAAVVDWARRTGGVILEDDYDGEFRYDRQPVGALQGLDPERVVYLGTASKSLAPGLRLAWMVLPQELVGEVLEAKGDVDWVSSALDQLTLAEFIASGAYDRHVRGMRLRYRRRRDQLVRRLAEHAPGIRVSGIAAGLHAVLELPPGTEGAAVRAAAWQGLAVETAGRFRHPDVPPGRDALVVGYATPSDSAWSGALDALCRALG